MLWAAFNAFGDAAAAAVFIQAFFVGMLGNLLPIPGGSAASRVDDRRVRGFGVDAGLAVVVVLLFRAFTFWLLLLAGATAFN